MKELIEQFFVEEKDEDEEIYFILNNQLELNFNTKQEATRFLIEAIRFWHDKRDFFCHDNLYGWEGKDEERKQILKPEDEWSFGYKTPSDCGGCVSGQRILDKIFGSRSEFNSLPFVEYHGGRSYSFQFDLLKHFAENGHDSTVQLIEEQEQKESQKKAEAKAEKQRKLREEQEKKLTEKLGDVEVSVELRRQILPYVDKKPLVVTKDIAVVKDGRSEWGSSGGIGYWDQVRVFYGSQNDMREWQWRDRYSASNDRHDLEIDDVGKVEVSEGEGTVSVKVELINKEYGNRSTTFTFDKQKAVVVPTLSVEKQTAFTVTVEKEVARIMENLNRLWECKPQMVASYPAGMTMPMGTPSYVSYRQPSIKQREFRPEIGVAAFVTEEQIDHRGSDPQLRFALYVLIDGKKEVEMKTESHGYNRTEGGAFLSILEIGPDCITINTKSGKSKISLDR